MIGKLLNLGSNMKAVSFGTAQEPIYTGKLDSLAELPAHTWYDNTVSNNIAIANISIPANKSGYQQAEYTGVECTLGVIGLDLVSSFSGQGVGEDFSYFLYVDSNSNYQAVKYNYIEYNTVTVPAIVGDLFRIIRYNKFIRAEYYRNGNWNKIYQFSQYVTTALFPKIGIYGYYNSKIVNPKIATQI